MWSFYWSDIRYQIEDYIERNKDTIISWILIGVCGYLLLYLIFRDTTNSFMSSTVVLSFVVICLLAVLYIQLRAYWYQRYYRTYYRPINFSKIYNEARLESLQNRQRRGMEIRENYNTMTRLNATRADPAFEFERHRFIPEYTTEYKYEPFTTNKSANYRTDLSRRQLSFGKYNTPYEYRNYNTTEHQGDAIDSMNDLAYRCYEKLNINGKIVTWVNNIKRWMGSNYIQLILTRHTQNLSQLNKILAPYGREITFDKTEKLKKRNDNKLLLLEELYDSVILNKYDLNELLLMGNYSFAYKTENTLKDELKELLQRRTELEQFFKINDFSPTQREYVIERLKRLQLNFSMEYNYNSGSEISNASLPKDSDVSLHIIIDYLLAFLYHDTAIFF